MSLRSSNYTESGVYVKEARLLLVFFKNLFTYFFPSFHFHNFHLYPYLISRITYLFLVTSPFEYWCQKRNSIQNMVNARILKYCCEIFSPFFSLYACQQHNNKSATFASGTCFPVISLLRSLVFRANHAQGCSTNISNPLFPSSITYYATIVEYFWGCKMEHIYLRLSDGLSVACLAGRLGRFRSESVKGPSCLLHVFYVL